MAVILDEWRVLPRLAFLAMIVMAWRVTEWYMALPVDEATVERSGFVSVVIGALTGAFAVWLGKENKADEPRRRRMVNHDEPTR